MLPAGEITQLLQDVQNGNDKAANQLFVLVEEDLKFIARKRKRAAAANVELSTTELVDDAFLRLVGRSESWHDGGRQKFFGYASNKIHDLLIESLRAQQAEKRGGRHQREDDGLLLADEKCQPLDDLHMLMDLKSALEKFETFAPKDAMLFRVRFFFGCTFKEAAEVVGLSVTESKRAFERARLWLQSELKEYYNDS